MADETKKQGTWDDFDQASAQAGKGAPQGDGTWGTFDQAGGQTGTTPANPNAQTGAFQTRPSGPTYNAKVLKIDEPKAAEGPTLKSVAREGALGLASGFSGLPETRNPLGTIWDEAKQGWQEFKEHPLRSAGLYTLKHLNPYQSLIDVNTAVYPAAKEAIVGTIDRDPETQAHGLGTLGGMALQMGLGAKAPESVGERSTTLRKLGGEPFGIGVTGEELFKKAISPRASATGWDAAVARPGVQRAIKEYHEGTPIQSPSELTEAIPEMQQKIWNEQVQPAIDRQAKRPVDMKPAAKAVRDLVTPEMREFDEGGAAQLDSLAEKLESSRDVEGANRLLSYVNGKLDSYFAKYPTARKAAMSNPETAGWEGARRAIREQFLNTLEQAGESQVRDARQDYGALETIRNEAQRRPNVADRAKPFSLARILGWTSAPLTGPLGPALGEVAHYINKPDVMLRRGISRLTPPEATPFSPPQGFEPPQLFRETQTVSPQERPGLQRLGVGQLFPSEAERMRAIEPIEMKGGFAKTPPPEVAPVLKETGWEYGGRSDMGIHEFKEPGTNASISIRDKDMNPEFIREKISAKKRELGQK